MRGGGRGRRRRTSGHVHALGYLAHLPVMLGRGTRGIITPRAERDGRCRCGGYNIVIVRMAMMMMMMMMMMMAMMLFVTMIVVAKG